MDRTYDTIRADELRSRHGNTEVTLFRNGKQKKQHIYIEGGTFDLDGSVSVEFGEYVTIFNGLMEVEISYLEGGLDYLVESITLCN